MAIVFVTVIGLAMAIALGYASTTIKATSKAYVPARTKFYTADAALKAAVAFTEKNPSEGKYTAPSTCSTARTYGTIDSKVFTTQVCPRTTTSLTGGGSGGGNIGVRTLATSSEKGIEVAGQGGLTVYGSVLVNSSIDVGNSSRLDVYNGQVKALSGCNRNVYIDGVLQTSCTSSPAPASDPNFTFPITAQPPAATGSCSNNVATLQPGIWSSATALDTAIGNCAYVQLAPGIHYLNNVDWTIKYRVVGGTLNGDIKTSAHGQGCVTKASTGGTTLVLGGTSTITLSGSTASLEICGQTYTQSDGSTVRLPLYGLKTDITGPATDVTLTGSSASSVTGTGTAWTNPSQAQTVDTTNVATASLAASASSQQLRIAGFSASPAMPASVTALTVDVYAATANSRAATMSVNVLNTSGTALCTAATASFPNTLSKVTVNLTCTAPLPSQLVVGITATAGASPAQARTLSVDGATITFSRPGSPIASAQSGCVSQVSGCDALYTSGNSNRIYLEGELYMPLAKINVQLPNEAGAFTTRGITVRVLKVNTPASIVDVPIVAIDYGGMSPGDVTVVVKVDGTSYMTCRVTFAVTGQTITGSTITACTSPN